MDTITMGPIDETEYDTMSTICKINANFENLDRWMILLACVIVLSDGYLTAI
jgi:hypothetical protein